MRSYRFVIEEREGMRVVYEFATQTVHEARDEAQRLWDAAKRVESCELLAVVSWSPEE